MSASRLILAGLGLVCFGAAASAQNAPVSGACAVPDSVAFRGNSRVTDAMLRADVGIAPKKPLNYRILRRAEGDLYATGQFSSVATSCDTASGKTLLIFSLAERPLLGDLAIVGPDRVSESTVREHVDLILGKPIDPSLVARSVSRIDSLYLAEGYALAKVKVDTTVANSQTTLTFRIEEGRRMAVSGIRIIGNTRLAAKDIVSGMDTKPEGFWFWQNGEFDPDKFTADLTEHIPALYGSRGFIDAQVVRDTMIVDRDRGKALIEITVSEGKQYHVGEFEVDGSKRFSSEEIAKLYPFGDRSKGLTETVKGIFHRSGDQDVFDKTAWEAATDNVRNAYADQGYIYGKVTPVIDRRTGKDSVSRVDLRWDIDEGTPAIVNRVDIQGNDVTSEQCIRDQIAILPGDVFARNLIIQSLNNIQNLGFFESPPEQPDTKPADEKGDLDLIFHVKEKRTGNVNFGASVGQGTGVGGFIGFDQPNLFGNCKRGSMQWQFGQYINDLTLTYSDPHIYDSQISGEVTAYHQQSRFVIANIGQSTMSGGQVQFGIPIPGSRYTRFYTSYGGERVNYSGGLVGTINCNGCFRSTLGFTLDHDTRAGMPFPFAGTHENISTQFNGGPLGGSAEFTRYVTELRSYATLAQFGGGDPNSQPVLLVLGLTARAGALFGDPGPFFVSQAFSLGGVQYGEPLRGYEEFSITPSGFEPNNGTFNATRSSFGDAFMSNTAEVGVRLNQMLYLDAFYDAGNLWARPQDFDPTHLFRGAGFGGSIVTPLGPLGVDLGYGFDRTNTLGQKAPGWQVHFKFGQLF